jgi:hypothetical protein
MQTLLVASRKGLFVVRGNGALWEITGHHFPGDPVTQVLMDPRNGHWYAALREAAQEHRSGCKLD